MYNFSNLDRFMETLITDFDIPGAGIIISQNGKELYRNFLGYTDLELQTPVDETSLFRLFSLSKPLTVTAALQLMEQGKFLMNDPIAYYLPAYWNTKMFSTDAQGNQTIIPVPRHITVGDLLTMRSGLTYCGNSNPTECAVSKAVEDLISRTGFAYTTRQFADTLAEAPILFEPGSHWNYSYSIDVIGALIEVWSGQSLEAYMQEHIFQPLGMVNTTFHPSASQREKLATMYEYSYETRKHTKVTEEERMPLYGGIVCEHGGHGLFSTVEDYRRFACALAQGGVYVDAEGNSRSLLSKVSITLMQTNHLEPEQLRDAHNWSQLVGYGYGLGVRTMMRREQAGILSEIGEFGWSGLGGGYLMVEPSMGLSVIYLQQMTPNREPEIHPRLRNVIWGCLGNQKQD